MIAMFSRILFHKTQSCFPDFVSKGLNCRVCLKKRKRRSAALTYRLPSSQSTDLSMEPMRGRAHTWMLLWLAFCLLKDSHSQVFPFPIPFFTPSHTNQQDVDAVNEFYISLGSPDLHGWVDSGGDPCEEAWQGVQCLGPNITAVELKAVGLEGKLTEALGKLTAITRLDLSSNNIGGELPDSMAMLKSLSTLHVQNNRLTGTLDVLHDLPLKDLNVENNLFSGLIPEKMLSIPKFLRSGNNFTVPVIPGSSPTPATSSPSPAAHPQINVIPAVTPLDTAHGVGSPRHSMKVSPAKAAGYSVLAASSLTIAVLVIVFVVSRRRRDRGFVMKAPSWRRDALKLGAAFNPDKERITVAEEIVGNSGDPSVHPSLKNNSMPNIVSEESLRFSFRFFTVASLQQCTNSFSDQNLMRETRLGKIYLAELPESKYAVLNLHDTAAKMAVGEFLKKVQTIADLRHPNIEELVGCCVEHGQRLLVYKHFSEHTLDDMIHGNNNENPGNNFLWEARIAVAIEAGRVLEYLHDRNGGGQERHVTAVVHGHFRPEHILVDAETTQVRVSGCGLGPFTPALSVSTSEDNWHDDDNPAEEAAAATGDVYGFGVVMLQLLTGRRPYDGARPRGERWLVPWAGARLHDLSMLRRMADPCLCGTPAPLPVRSLSRFADIISRCLQREAEFRPAMAEVVQDLRCAMEEARGVSGVRERAPARG